MAARPTVILIVGIFLIATSAFCALVDFMTLGALDNVVVRSSDNAVPSMWVELACNTLSLICSIGIMSGQNWARWTFVATIAVVVAFEVYLLPGKLYTLVPAMGFRLITLICLFIPDANDYFSSRSRHGWRR
jgi:hypothetical protein